MKLKKAVPGLALTAVASLLLSACSGEVGASAEGEGFDFDAPQAVVDEIVANHEPVTLNFQPQVSSPNSSLASGAEAFKDYIEERSNGQITIDIVYGQAIAGNDEVGDALADGRLDLAVYLPIYEPSEYPTYDAYMTALHGLPATPALGEAITYAAATELAWKSDSLIEEYTSKGLTPLTPMMASGSSHQVCTEPGSKLSDMQGRQLRIASSSHVGLAETVGASPVSMDYVEVYEALQRGTIDCTVGSLSSMAQAGIFEVAPHLTYFVEDHSLSTPGTLAKAAGSSFKDLPLPYQQIIFDAQIATFDGFVNVTGEHNAIAASQIKEAEGSITPVNPETGEITTSKQEEQVEELIAQGRLEEDFQTQIDEIVAKWTAVANELGLPEDGDFENVDEWWERIDLTEFAMRVTEETALHHRPE